MVSTFGEVLAALDAIAPLRFAEDWDNVGLLVEPAAFTGARGRRRPVRRIMLAIDATAAVFAQALAWRCDVLVAYHPPIFAGLKALRASAPRTRGLRDALAGELAVYSPHTALDAVAGGVCDWLAIPFGRARAAPLRQLPGAPVGVGPGRALELDAPLTLRGLLPRLKRHLGVRHLRVAPAPAGARAIRRVALVPGAGGSLLLPHLERHPTELVVTGELRHHDVLAATEAGVHVVLAEHSHTERGYLAVLARTLRAALGRDVEIRTAAADREPLRIT